MKYYTHIDGLRAISILSILFYHAGFTSFRSGFIGVDIFFVISGFLITLTIINDEKFSYSNFYERRVRRILPALFIMCIFSIISSWFLLTPKELKDFGRSLFSSTNMISNFYFWKTQNYHAQIAQYKPLIHTWSLSIEEQYYLLFPVFLIFIRRHKYYLLFLLLVAFSSFFLSWLLITINKEAVAFYFPICRAWELLLGGVAAIYQKYYPKRNFYISCYLISIIGIILILISLLIPFENPSIIQSFIATIGTVLVIIYTNDDNLVGKFLSHKYLTLIGLSSFSIYLYHQPLFAFYRAHFLYVDNITYFYLIISSILIGAVSYYLVEKPFKKMNKYSLYTILFLLWTTLSIFGILSHVYDGFPNRYSNEAQKLLNYQNYDYGNYLRSGRCLITEDQNFKTYPLECYGNSQRKSDVIIWGDSHAAGLFYGFSNQLQNVAQFTTTSCPPFINEIYNRKQCNNINQWVLNEIYKIKPKEVFLHAYWSCYNQKSLISVTSTVNEIKKLSPSSKITIIGNTPFWHPSLPLLLVKYSNALEIKNDYLPFQIEQSILSDKLLESFTKKTNINFISALNLLCIKDECLYKIKSEDSSSLIFYDSDHLTKEGSLYISNKILNNQLR